VTDELNEMVQYSLRLLEDDINYLYLANNYFYLNKTPQAEVYLLASPDQILDGVNCNGFDLFYRSSL
jgi:hypothetical protein